MKKNLKNKTFLGLLSTGAIIAPVAVAVSCSKAVLLTSVEAETNSRLENVGAKIERTYQEQLLTKLNTELNTDGTVKATNFVAPYRKLNNKAEWDKIVDDAATKGNGALNFLIKQIAGVDLSTNDALKPLEATADHTNFVSALKALVVDDATAQSFGYLVDQIEDFLKGKIISTDSKGQSAYLNVNDLIKYYIKESVFANRNFLKTLGSTLISLDESKLVKNDQGNEPVVDENGNFAKISYADIDRYGLLNEVGTDGIPKIKLNNASVSLYDPTADAIFNELIKVLIKSNYSDFISGVYKFFISINYFNTTKEEWEKVYNNKNDFDKYFREYQPIEKEIAPENFLITKEVIKDKPFFSWTATLDENTSKQFMSVKPEKTIDEVDALMGGRTMGTTAVKPLAVPYTTKHKQIASYQSGLLENVSGRTLVTSNSTVADNMLGFAGLTKQAPVGTESLSFTQDQMEKATGTEISTKTGFTDLITKITTDAEGFKKLLDIEAQLKGTSANLTAVDQAIAGVLNKTTAGTVVIDTTKIQAVIDAFKTLATDDATVASWNFINLDDSYTNAYNGYLYKNEVKQKEIELIASGVKTVAVNKLIGVMPAYVNGQFKMAQFNTVDKITALKEELYFLDSKDIYDDALTYFTNRPGAKELLTIKDDYLRTLAIDKWGYSFIDKDNNPDNNN